MTDLPTKYRPTTFDKVIGQKVATSSLKRLVTTRAKHAFLITGPSGVGKTTLARIAARELGALGRDTLEIDGATHTGIDAWKQIRSTLQYAPMGEAGASRAVILDEGHRLSKNAWDSLLKDLEEPPKHLFWFICTTEPSKIPKAIVNRCAAITLRNVGTDDIFDLVDMVCQAEKYTTSDKVCDMIASKAHGSPRQALAFLEICWDKTEEEAADMMQAVADERKPTDLVFGLLNKTLNWKQAVQIVVSLEDRIPAESLRRIMIAVMGKSLVKRKTLEEAEPVLAIIEEFTPPFPSDAKATEVLSRIAAVLLGR